MDDAPFALDAARLVLHQAGIRHLLPAQTARPEEGSLSREPWAGFMAKVPPAPLSIWTYSELGFDLTGHSEPARGNLWRSLIQLVGLPRGSVGFFPYSLPDSQGTSLHLECFFQAITSIVPLTIIIFDDNPGNELLQSLQHTPNILPATVTWHTAPSPDALLKLSRDELMSVSKRFQAFLHICD